MRLADLIALVVMECKAFKNRIKSDDFCSSTNIEVRRKKYMSHCLNVTLM